MLVRLPVRDRSTIALAGVITTILGASIVGLFAAARIDRAGPFTRSEFHFFVSFPIAVYPVAALGIFALVLMRNHWWTGLLLFFVWLPFEDLVRKFAGNDLRLYFVKDGLLFVAVLGVLPRLAGSWLNTLGAARLPTLAVFGTAAVMSIPGAVVGAQLPAIGIHARFLYALLFPVGVYLARSRETLAKALFWLAALAAAVCVLGIVQAVVGPTFLNPTSSTLQHLTVLKSVGQDAVARPSGPFTDVSRFASITILAVVLALCSFRLAEGRRRHASLVMLLVGLVASFASGSRTSVLISVPFIAFAVLFPAHRSRFARAPFIFGAIAVAVLFGVLQGPVAQKSADTASLYAETINPASSRFELGYRLRTYSKDAVAGIRDGHYFGTGTGTETLGKQYLQGAFVGSGTESGWGSVAAEWGVAGLAIWIFWTFAWVRRSVLACRVGATLPIGPVLPIIALYLGALLVVMFSFGLGFFENYVANVFFWLLSGICFSVFADRPEPVVPTEHAAHLIGGHVSAQRGEGAHILA